MKRSALIITVAAGLGLPLAAQSGDRDDADAACVALGRMADDGELTVGLALKVLGGSSEAEARTVAAIIRHEWAALPDELFDGLDLDARAARVLLDELAQAPRPAARRTTWISASISNLRLEL